MHTKYDRGCLGGARSLPCMDAYIHDIIFSMRSCKAVRPPPLEHFTIVQSSAHVYCRIEQIQCPTIEQSNCPPPPPTLSPLPLPHSLLTMLCKVSQTGPWPDLLRSTIRCLHLDPPIHPPTELSNSMQEPPPPIPAIVMRHQPTPPSGPPTDFLPKFTKFWEPHTHTRTHTPSRNSIFDTWFQIQTLALVQHATSRGSASLSLSRQTKHRSQGVRLCLSSPLHQLQYQ